VTVPAVPDQVTANYPRAFGLAVRDARQRLGLSQEAFAEHSGIHRTYVSGIERGLRNPSLTAIFRVADGLGISASALLDATEAHLRRSA